MNIAIISNNMFGYSYHIRRSHDIDGLHIVASRCITSGNSHSHPILELFVSNYPYDGSLIIIMIIFACFLYELS